MRSFNLHTLRTDPNPFLTYRARIVKPQSHTVKITLPTLKEALVLPASLSQDSQDIYQLLHRLAESALQATGGNSAQATHHTMLLPAEVLFTELGIPQRTFYLRLKELHKAGLVDSRGHKTTITRKGKQTTVNDGTLFKILMRPDGARKAATRLSLIEFKADYGRRLEDDIAQGRTAFKILGGEMNGGRKTSVPDVAESSKSTTKTRSYFSDLLDFAIPAQIQPALKNDSVSRAADARTDVLERIFTAQGLLLNAGKIELNKIVADLARDFTRILGDNSFRFWCWLFHNMTRLNWAGRNFFPFLQGLLLRAFTGNQDRELKNSSAWIVSQLKSSGLWDELSSV